VKHIAESHGGSVSVTSPITEDGRGSAFELSLPALERGREAAEVGREPATA
jgi:two-component system phosphate regulon sensor histidine kinase PhoR